MKTISVMLSHSTLIPLKYGLFFCSGLTVGFMLSLCLFSARRTGTNDVPQVWSSRTILDNEYTQDADLQLTQTSGTDLTSDSSRHKGTHSSKFVYFCCSLCFW